MIRVRVPLVALLLLGAPVLGRAADCLVEAASFARAQSRPVRLILLPPRVHLIGEERPGEATLVAPAPVLADTLVPEVHCGLEALGYEVDALSLAGPSHLRRTDISPRAVDLAWQSLRRLTRKACEPDIELQSGEGVPEAVAIADATHAEGLVFVQAITLLRGKGFRAFVRAVETVAPDIRFPGATDDLTWVEIAIVDGRTGELLALTAEVIERRLARNPRAIAVEAVAHAIAVLPERDEPTAWGLELTQANLGNMELPPRCLLSSSPSRRNFERMLENAAGGRRIDGERDQP